MILTFEKLQEIKPMSINNKPYIMQLVKETEEFKIQKLLGSCVYNKIVDEIKSGDISDELSIILNDGLYSCITYMVYARYLQESMLQDTFTGMVNKVRPDSQTASTGSLKNVANEYSDMAMYNFGLVRDKIISRYGSASNSVETNKFSSIESVSRHNGKYNKCVKISYL